MDLLSSRFPQIARRLLERAAGVDTAAALRSESADWDALLERWLEGLDLKKGTAFALSGLGDGRHVSKLLKRLPSGCVVFCGEPSVAVARRVCEGAVGEELLRDERFFLGAGELDEAFFEGLPRFPVLEIENAEPLIFAPLFEKDEAFFGAFFLEFARGVDYWRKLWGTNVIHSGDWQSNTVRNLMAMIGRPDLGELSGRFKGSTMILVSAGPSLDESLESLKAVGDRALIVGVNSSYRAMRNAGIVPHFVLAADPYESTARGFVGVPTDCSILVSPFIVYPKVVGLFGERVVSWSGRNALACHFRQRLGLGLGAEVVEQGTVSACAFDLAKIFGCRRVVMVGQDLAAREDGRTHATDSFYTTEGGNFTDTGACRWLPGNTLERVPVESKLYVYLKVFEKLTLAYGAGIEFVNTARLGARIEGVPYQPVDEALAGLMAEGTSVLEAFEDLRLEMGRPRADAAALDLEIERVASYLQTACAGALSIAMELEVGDEGEGAGDALLASVAAKKEGLARHLASDPSFEAILNEGQLKYELLLHKKQLRALDELDSREAREVESLKGYSWALAEGAFRLLSDLNRCSGVGRGDIA